MNDRTNTEGDVLLRCMAAVAGADGAVDDTEMAEITGIYRELTGRAPTEAAVREAVDAAWYGGIDAAGFVTTAGREADLETRVLIATACYRVLSSDGEITGSEARTFNAIVDGMGVPRKELMRRLE